MTDQQQTLRDILSEQLSFDDIWDLMCHFFNDAGNCTFQSSVLSTIMDDETIAIAAYDAMLDMIVEEISEKEIYEATDIATKAFLIEQELNSCEAFIDKHNIGYSRVTENDICVGIECSGHTPGGVEMRIFIDGRDKDMSEDNWWHSEIIDAYNSFDIDEEIDLHRQDGRYREAFSIAESLEDFKSWAETLETLYNDL